MNEKDSESAAFEKWLSTERPGGDVEEVQRKWESSHEYREWLDDFPSQKDTMNETESLRTRIASLEAELASHYKRRAAIEAMDAYNAHAATHAQEIADEASGMLDKFLANPNSYPVTAEYLRLRNEADRLRKEVQP